MVLHSIALGCDVMVRAVVVHLTSDNAARYAAQCLPSHCAALGCGVCESLLFASGGAGKVDFHFKLLQYDAALADLDRQSGSTGKLPQFAAMANFLNGDLARRLADVLVLSAAAAVEGCPGEPPVRAPAHGHDP